MKSLFAFLVFAAFLMAGCAGSSAKSEEKKGEDAFEAVEQKAEEVAEEAEALIDEAGEALEEAAEEVEDKVEELAE